MGIDTPPQPGHAADYAEPAEHFRDGGDIGLAVEQAPARKDMIPVSCR